MSNYLTDLPSPEEVRERYNKVLTDWKQRNEFIARVRTHLTGQNVVMTPENTSFVARPVHTYILQAIMNEKAARFTLLPKIQVIPTGTGPRSREASSDMEQGLSAIQYWAERMGDGNVWSRVIEDAIAFDGGVERIEAAPSAHWPELAPVTIKYSDGSVEEKEKMYADFIRKNGPAPNEEQLKKYKKFREDYKKQAGAPIRFVYVAPENFFPIYEGAVCVEAFEREERALRDVLRQPLYSDDAKAALSAAASQLSESEKLGKRVVIIHHVNGMYHSYWALLPTVSNSNEGVDASIWPTGQDPTSQSIGTPVLLHSYRHGLGRVIYNIVNGRYGGWKNNTNAIERVMSALMDLSQVADEVASQVATNISTTYWPTIIEELDPERRNTDSSGNRPQSLKAKPGQHISLWKGENVRIMETSAPNPTAQWFFQTLTNQMEKLAGSAAIYGQQDPGVRTGYHAFLQISQSEHLDEKLEINLASGAIDRGLIVLSHIRELGEPVYVFHRYSEKGGQRSGRYISIDPKSLSPLPELDATVRKPRPIDYDAAVRTAMSASQDRAGEGTPLLDDDTIRERILGEDAPDLIEQKIAIQNEKRRLIESGVLSQIIVKKIGLKMSESSTPAADPNAAASADPALLAAAGQAPSAGMGGISPDTALAMLQGGAANGVNPFPVPQAMPPGPMTPPPPPMQGAPQATPIPQIPAGIPAPPARQGVGGGPPPMMPQTGQNIARAIDMHQRTGA